MTDLYVVYIGLKWLHIVAAAIAFGSNVAHFFWILAANHDPLHRANILRLVKKIDDRLSVPAYAVMVACGVAMWLWQWPLYSSWIIASLVLTALLSAMGIAFGPFMRRWIHAAASPPAGHPPLILLQQRLTCWWAGIVLTVPLILWFMVRKPVLW